MAGLSTGTTDTTTQSDELCIGCIGFDVNETMTGGSNSFTKITERTSGGAPDIVVLERMVSATGTYGTTIGWDMIEPLEYGLCGAIATFKADIFTPRKSSGFLVQ
jgi:hypothetical protein